MELDHHQQEQYQEQYQDQQLRPQNFSDFIGQQNTVENLNLMLQSAQMENRPIDHILFAGPPGLGKTSLSMIVSSLQKGRVHLTTGPALTKKSDLASIVASLGSCDVLFIDEIHRLNLPIEEMLYSVMEDFRLDIILGQGTSARVMPMPVAPFTLIGATTKLGQISTPLRERFIGQYQFAFYTPFELKIIIQKNALKLKVNLSEESLDLLASCARGTPRVANRILRRVRDFVVVNKLKEVHLPHVKEVLRLLELGEQGLQRMDQKILFYMGDVLQGRPVGLEALASYLSEDKQTIEDVYEPYLMQIGFIARTPRGRVLTEEGKKYLRRISLKS